MAVFVKVKVTVGDGTRGVCVLVLRAILMGGFSSLDWGEIEHEDRNNIRKMKKNPWKL